MPHPSNPSHRNDPTPRDKAFVNTGWGVKPDDQPANSDQTEDQLRQITYTPDTPEVPATPEIPDAPDAPDAPKIPGQVIKILRHQRQHFSRANRVVVSRGKTIIYDINNDPLTIVGLGYGSAHLIDLLKAVGAAFDPRALKQIPADDPDTRQYDLGKVWAWGEERSG